MTTIARPAAGEFAPFYSGYIAAVPDGDLVAIAEAQGRDLLDTLTGLSDEQALHRYAPDKWTIKEVLGHITDAERIFTYRALRIARGDATPLASFDQDAYVQSGNAGRRTLRDLLDEFSAVRGATLALFRSLSADEAARLGTASNASVSARGLCYITVGHAGHHLRILKERYLQA
jgi:hypothetical protein